MAEDRTQEVRDMLDNIIAGNNTDAQQQETLIEKYMQLPNQVR